MQVCHQSKEGQEEFRTINLMHMLCLALFFIFYFPLLLVKHWLNSEPKQINAY